MLYALSLALKIGMLIDAFHRRAPLCWALAIILLPFGEVVYFALIVAPGLLPAGVFARKPRRPSLEEVRYHHRENPCHENRLMLAERLLEEGVACEAQESFEALLADAPDDRNALFGLARCHLARDQRAAGIAALERLVEQRRSFADYGAWRMLAEALSEDGRHEDAIVSLERLAKAAPRLLHQLALAQAQDRAGRATEARATLEAALEAHRHAPRFLRRESKEPARRATKLLGRLQAV